MWRLIFTVLYGFSLLFECFCTSSKLIHFYFCLWPNCALEWIHLIIAVLSVPIKIWRSFFKYEKPVKHYGNEAVNHYFASYYPPVPSTGGSVISRDLATFLTHNMNHLIHGFSNIHNSMAVWLAPAAPSYYEDTDWFDDIYQAKTKQSIDKTCKINKLKSQLYFY